MGDIYTIVEIMALLDSTAPRTLAKLARLDWWCYHITAPRLQRYKRIYQRYLPRFAMRLWRRLIRYPIKYDGYITAICKYDEMPVFMDRPLLFDIDALPPDVNFWQQYRVALYNVTLWVTRPFEAYVCLTRGVHMVCYRHVKPADCVKIDDDLWYVQLNLPGEHNPILFGSPILSHLSIGMCVTRSIAFQYSSQSIMQTEVEHDLDFADGLLKKVIASYYTVSENSYDWSNYAFGAQCWHRSWLTWSFVHRIRR